MKIQMVDLKGQYEKIKHEVNAVKFPMICQAEH